MTDHKHESSQHVDSDLSVATEEQSDKSLLRRFCTLTLVLPPVILTASMVTLICAVGTFGEKDILVLHGRGWFTHFFPWGKDYVAAIVFGSLCLPALVGLVIFIPGLVRNNQKEYSRGFSYILYSLGLVVFAWILTVVMFCILWSDINLGSEMYNYVNEEGNEYYIISENTLPAPGPSTMYLAVRDDDAWFFNNFIIMHEIDEKECRALMLRYGGRAHFW